jgi:predicted LPLAT superfamily acyltransferase
MSHWSEEKEKKGSTGQMRFLFSLYRLLGARLIRIILHPVVFCFYIFSVRTRRFSRSYLERVFRLKGEERRPGFRDLYRHFYSFSYVLIEKLAAWSGDMGSASMDKMSADEKKLTERLAEGKGAVVICSHLGNTEMLRAFGSMESGTVLPDFKIHALVDFSGTARFNALLQEINPKSMVRLVDVNSIDPSVIIRLQEALDRGDLVVIAGDRTAGKNRMKNTELNFLGERAYFPQGAFVMASLLDASLYYMFALRKKDGDYDSPYQFFVHESHHKGQYTRRERKAMIGRLTEEFARSLIHN